MKIAMIAAMAKNRVIWNKNQLPWNISEDLQHFKKITTGQVIVMWYNTYLSLWKPLPNRRNIVLSADPIEGVETFSSFDLLLETLEREWVDLLFIIWWASVYKQFIQKTDYLYLTEIKEDFVWDTYFPDFDGLFDEVSREEHPTFDFVEYKKKAF